MHSSASVTCRALAMLLGAIVIPLMAIARAPVADLTEQLWNRWAGSKPMQVADARTEAPPFRPVPTVETSVYAPASELPQRVDSPMEAGQLPLPQGSPSIPLSVSAIGAIPRSAVGQDAQSQAVIPTAKADDTILASYETTSTHTPLRSSSPDDAEYIQKRLRQLGAVHYVLEPWGSGGNYRFSCRIAINGNPEYTRYFEATSRDGLSAMNRVLQQAEAWSRLR